MDKYENNRVTLVGVIASDFTYSHEVYGEKFYTFLLEVNRLSSVADYIPIIISERLIDVKKTYEDFYVCIQGWFRSYNLHEEGKSKLLLSVTVREIELLPTQNGFECVNKIFLDGYVCKAPTYRTTPLGRTISDLLIAVNRSYGKSDYLPSICWSNNAVMASYLEVGSHVQIEGRIQSRMYIKRVSETEVQERIAYEVSVNKIII